MLTSFYSSLIGQSMQTQKPKKYSKVTSTPYPVYNGTKKTKNKERDSIRTESVSSRRNKGFNNHLAILRAISHDKR